MEIIKKQLEKINFFVEEIVLYKKDSRLVINSTTDTIINYENLHKIEDEFLNRNKKIKKINIKSKYTGDHTIEEKANLLIPNILYILGKFCPATNTLKDCFSITHSIDDNTLNIFVKASDKIVKKDIENKKVIESIKQSFFENFSIKSNIFLEDECKNYSYEELVDKINELDKKSKDSNIIIEDKKMIKSDNKAVEDDSVIKGKLIKSEAINISDINDGDRNIVIEGEIFASDSRKLNSNKFLQTFVLSDKTSSIMCKIFWDDEKSFLKNGSYIKVKGDANVDNFSRELTVTPKDIVKSKENKRKDTADNKRVELHLHTNMSSMDGVNSAKDLIKKAKDFGHRAIAITDHGVVQAFPDAMDAGAKNDIKVIYGIEGYIVDDTKKVLKEYNELTLDQTFIVFDIETTGLSALTEEITEIGAVKIVEGKIVDYFSALINPQRKLSKKIIELTGITDEMLEDKPTIDIILPQFMEFIDGAMLVAHNSDFDTGFIREKCRRLGIKYNLKAIDTVTVSRALLTNLKSHKLNLVAKELGVVLENHHRAVDDAKATAEIFIKFLEMFKEKGVVTLDEVNHKFVDADYKTKRPNHIILLVKNLVGLKNLYKIVSDSHVKHFYKQPRILKSFLNQHREGLLVGSACESGEVFSAVMKNVAFSELKDIIDYYDYLEIMPTKNNQFLVDKQILKSEQEIININKTILKLGDKVGKLVVATGDVHYLEKEDSVVKDILSTGKNIDNGSLYFRTTDEMLEEFSYLGESDAYRVVVENSNKIADMIEEIKPIPDGTFPPIIEGSDIELREMCNKKAESIYGNPLPDVVKNRLDRELNSIIGNGYAVMYIIAQKLVTKSIRDGYLVGSRGSVGSSFAATMSDITEVNPLPPHYICKNCKYSEFFEDGSIANGADLNDKSCPKCGEELIKDGHDIPFETFLGFKGDKEPDIDLNFAGEYQSNAHKYTEELFGKDYVFRAGTINTVAEKTAYGYVRKYAEDYGVRVSTAESLKLRDKATGVKKTTGQHPGGVMVVPNYKDIYDFTPIQFPANMSEKGVYTTHFDYHSISGRILKLDILGHDVPTIIKMLEDFTDLKATDIKLDNKETMGIFTSTKPLLCNLDEINCETGTLGIPEFGTKFVRQMLIDTQPKTFAELVQISGLSHGTDVWINNAQEIIKKGIVTLKDVISTRDDIMNYLIQKKLDPLMSFKIMENVRKGKGLTDEHIQAMIENNVPSWYIESCQKIKYMFPKAHAAAYVMMSFRIAYYKVFHKEAFYATFFSTKAEDFDIRIISKGEKSIVEALKEIESKGNDATPKESSMVPVLEVAYEMLKRKVEVLDVDIYLSDAKKFKIVDNKLLPPLIAIPGLGETVAQKISEESQKEFISIEDFRKRTKASNTVIDTLREFGCLNNLPENNQLSLFNF